MNSAELYQKSNTLQKRDARQCLEEYAKKIKWKNYGDTVIDIGCGDGSVTSSILRNFIPNNCKELVGCDISEKMVQFANAHHARDFISFTVLDIEGDLPDQIREKFDHAFSFYTLHWIKHQEIAFSNIYDLLTRGGDCLLMFLGHMPVFDVYRELARTPRWNYWLRDVDRFVSPYHDCQDPEKDIKRMMINIGFSNVEVKCVEKIFFYTSLEAVKKAVNAVNPFKIPLEMQEDFLEDYIKVVHDMHLVDHVNNNEDGPVNVKTNYHLIIVYGKKIAFSNVNDLLARGGDCLFMIMGHMPLYDVYRELARSPRWNNWMKDVERIVSPYHDCQDPEKDIKSIMASKVFTNVIVKRLPKVFVFTGIESFKNAIKAVNVFKVPLDMEDDFIDDQVKVFHDMKLVYHRNKKLNHCDDDIQSNYSLWQKVDEFEGIY